MRSPAETTDPASPEVITELILHVFRTNGALLAAGDRLVAELGLTSARWQLLGGIARQAEALSVAQLARHIGVTRQAVQRIANELERDGIIAFRANPRHRRAQLVELSPRGRRLFERAMALQRPWADALGRGVPVARARECCDTLDRLLAALGKHEAAVPEHTDARDMPSI